MSIQRSPSLKIWTRRELEREAARSCQVFVRTRMAEGGQPYKKAFLALRPRIEALLSVTKDLNRRQDASWVKERPHLEAARYFLGPPISADDLHTLTATLVGMGLTEREAVQKIVWEGIDPFRFSWVSQHRQATSGERRIAVDWTAGLWAAEKVRTGRRTGASAEQEDAVRKLLLSTNYSQKDSRAAIQNLDDLPRGFFSKERKLGSSKCDVPVRLRDGRLLAIECKVSNSSLNSIKRLLREVGGKAKAWEAEFGKRVLVVAVLQGVFKLDSLEQAQEEFRVALIWQHDMAPLKKFLERTR